MEPSVTPGTDQEGVTSRLGSSCHYLIIKSRRIVLNADVYRHGRNVSVFREGV